MRSLGNVDDENSFFYLHWRYRKKWMPYGATTLFAVYGQFDTGFTRRYYLRSHWFIGKRGS